MGRARPDLIRIFEENPPGPHAGITLVRRVGTREYEIDIGPRGYLTQIEAAAFLRKSLMTVKPVCAGRAPEGCGPLRDLDDSVV